MAGPLIYAAICLVGYALVQKRLSTTAVTGPIVFVALGILASERFFGVIDGGAIKVEILVDVLFQSTLVLVLFTDASTLTFSSWRKDSDYPSRLLGIGLPLTIAAGMGIAALLFTDLGIWEAAIIGAIIAPTDAALGQAVISNPRVPERIRQALDVESGLNDGVSLPFVLIFMSLAEQAADTGPVSIFIGEIGIAVVVGLAVGGSGGWLLYQSSKIGFVGPAWSSIAVIGIAFLAFLIADEGGGSGFISAFVAGLTYGQVTKGKLANDQIVAADLGLGLIHVSFLAFGAVILMPALDDLTWQVVAMALLALTIARMVPVAISMIGTGLKTPSILYMGWFGPRGLATIVFGVLVVTSSDLPGTSTITDVAVITVGLSVLLHGVTAYAGAERYADWYESQAGTGLVESKKVHHHHLGLASRIRRLDPKTRTATESTGTPPPDESETIKNTPT